MPMVMDEATRKEMLTLFAGVVKEELDKSGVSLDKFMEAVEAKYFPPQRKYGLTGQGLGASPIKGLNKEAVTHVGKIFIAMRDGNTSALKALSAGTDEEGGYLVPSEVYAELIGLPENENRVRNLVRVLPVTKLTGKVPKVLSGATLTNVDEAGNYGETGATFGQVAYKVHKFGGIIPVTQELLSDSPFDVGQFVLNLFFEAARNTEALQVMTGAGDTNNAIGIFKATAGYTRTAATGTGLTYDDLFKRYAKLKAAFKAAAKWLMNTDGMLACGLIKDDQGKPIFVPNPREMGEFMMLGKSVEIYDEIPTAAGKTQIAFGDWMRAYFMFDRQQISMLTTNVGGDSFKRGTTDTRADERIDGAPANEKAAEVLYDVVVPA